MTLRLMREFLESSTIHGLQHISRAKYRTARITWVAPLAIVVDMITSSYKEWQEFPVSTIITYQWYHPTTVLEFPIVAVCSPKGSNTAVNFTKKEKSELYSVPFHPQ